MNILEILLQISAVEDEEAKKRLLDELARSVTDDALHEGLQETLAAIAREDSPEGFFAFYRGLFGARPLWFNEKAFVKQWNAHKEGRMFLYLGFRGCRKTTTFAIAQAAWLVGLYPDRTGIITGANEKNCDLIAGSIARIIEYHPFWKRAFPAIVPDKTGDGGRGWGADGYWVIDTRYSRQEWAEKQAAVNDPTFVGGGYASSKINGRHPSLFLFVDDLHDIDTMNYPLENERIKTAFTTQILKTAVRGDDGKLKTRVTVLGVPFTTSDTYALMKTWDGVETYELPVMRRAMEGEDGAVYIDGRHNGRTYDDVVGWWKLTWPEAYPPSAILDVRSEGRTQFWQMMMVDITVQKNAGLRFISYPHEKIDPQWQHGAGVDWAAGHAGGSYFAMVIGCKTPLNQIVVTDAVVERLSQAQSEALVAGRPAAYHNWRGTLIEGDGGGEVFYNAVLLRNPGIALRMEKSGSRSKAYRQEREMGPWLENGLVLISDADTPGLSMLRQALQDYPDGNNDVRDALYWLCRLFRECLRVPKDAESPDERPARVRKHTWKIGAVRV